MQRSPQDCRAHLDVLLPACLKYIKYDPNFADDEDEEMDADQEGGEEEEEEEEG